MSTQADERKPMKHQMPKCVLSGLTYTELRHPPIQNIMTKPWTCLLQGFCNGSATMQLRYLVAKSSGCPLQWDLLLNPPH